MLNYSLVPIPTQNATSLSRAIDGETASNMLTSDVEFGSRRPNSLKGDELARPTFGLACLLTTGLTLDTVAGFKTAARFDTTANGLV